MKQLDHLKPYVDEHILSLIKEQNRLLKLYNKRPITYGDAYRTSRNNVTTAIRNARKSYYNNRFHENERDPKKMWGIINELIGRNSQINNTIRELNYNNMAINSDVGIANCFNDYFADIGQKLSENFTVSTGRYLDYISVAPSNSFHFSLIGENEVLNIISKMNNTGPGPDEIPMFIFKDYAHLMLKALTHLINANFIT